MKNYINLVNNAALSSSDEIVKNGGLPYASILLSVLFKHCDKIARIYCNGFKPELVCSSPFWQSFKNWLYTPGHTLLALVETTDYINDDPMILLKKIKEYGKNNISVKLIGQKGIEHFKERWGEPMHFSVFDYQKFRYEYDPENYRAYGSFNQPKNAAIMIEEFDKIFYDKTSTEII